MATMSIKAVTLKVDIQQESIPKSKQFLLSMTFCRDGSGFKSLAERYQFTHEEHTGLLESRLGFLQGQDEKVTLCFNLLPSVSGDDLPLVVTPYELNSNSLHQIEELSFSVRASYAQGAYLLTVNSTLDEAFTLVEEDDLEEPYVVLNRLPLSERERERSGAESQESGSGTTGLKKVQAQADLLDWVKIEKDPKQTDD